MTNLYFVGHTDDDWDDKDNWATESGGSTHPDAAPTQNDDCFLDGSSPACEINATTCVCSTLDCSNYTNTLTFTASQTLTSYGSVTFVSGMTISGTGTLKLAGSGTLTSGTKTFPGSILFKGCGTCTLADDATITGSVTAESTNVSINGAFNFNIATDLTLTGVSIAGTATIVMNGTGSISCSNISSVITINLTFNTTGTITISGTIYYKTKTLTYTAGTITVTSSTLDLRGACTINTAGMSWNNVTFKTAGTYTLSSDMDVNGNLYWGGAITTSGVFNINVATSFAPLSSVNAGFGGTATVIMDGTGNMWTRATSEAPTVNITINTTGTITIGKDVPGSRFWAYKTGTITYTAGTVVACPSFLGCYIQDSCTFNVNGWGFTGEIRFNVSSTITMTSAFQCGALTLAATTCTFSGAFTVTCSSITTGVSTVTLTLSGDVDCSGTVTSGGTSLTLDGGQTLYIGGGLTATGYIAGTSAIILDGTGTWQGTSTTGVANNITINTAGTITISGTVYYKTGTLTYTAGTVTTTSSTLDLRGACTLNISGMSMNNITFTTAGSYTITTGLQLTGALTVSAACTFSNFAITGPPTTITLVAGSTQTMSGTFTIAATAANRVALASSSTTLATISKASGTVTLDYVDIGAVSATGGALFNANSKTNTFTNGNALGWMVPNIIMPMVTNI